MSGGGASSISYIQNRHSQEGKLHPYHIFIIASGGGATSISYIQNRYSQEGKLHPYHIFIIGVVRGRGVALSTSYIHNSTVRAGIYSYHIFIIVSEGGAKLHLYHIFIIGVVRGRGGFIHII